MKKGVPLLMKARYRSVEDVRKSAGAGLLLLFHTPFTQGASASADRLSWPHHHGNPHTSCRADPKLSEHRFARAPASFIDIRNIGGHRPPPPTLGSKPQAAFSSILVHVTLLHSSLPCKKECCRGSVVVVPHPLHAGCVGVRGPPVMA